MEMGGEGEEEAVEGLAQAILVLQVEENGRKPASPRREVAVRERRRRRVRLRQATSRSASCASRHFFLSLSSVCASGFSVSLSSVCASGFRENIELEWMFWFLRFVEESKSFRRNGETRSFVPDTT
ncbi:unnamed protein product [Urochloa humidicola]